MTKISWLDSEFDLNGIDSHDLGLKILATVGISDAYHFPSTSRAKCETLHGDIEGPIGNKHIDELVFADEWAQAEIPRGQRAILPDTLSDLVNGKVGIR